MNGTEKSPTIKTIAEAAGVSRGTVDRALNNRGEVAQDVARRIQTIADELGYVPNKAAKALRFNLTPRTIGVLLPATSDGFFASVTEGVMAAELSLAGMGINTRVERFEPSRSESFEQELSALLATGVAGLVVTGPDTEATRAAVEQATGTVPVVTVNSDIRAPGRLCFVGQDLVQSGRVAGELMAKMLRGPGSVIAVTGNLEFQAHQDRVLGFQAALSQWQPAATVEVLEGFDSYEGTTPALSRALAQTPRPSGLFMATGSVEAALEQLKRSGLAGSLPVITNDMVPAVRRGLNNRIIDFTILQDPFHQGERPIRILADMLLSGRKPAELWHRSPIVIAGAEAP